MIIERAVAIARRTKGTRQAVYLDHITVATVNAFVVCPEGNPGLVGISPRATIPSEGTWNGLGRLKAAFNKSVRLIAVTIATASISELVHSLLSLRKTQSQKTRGAQMRSPTVATPKTRGTRVSPDMER